MSDQAKRRPKRVPLSSEEVANIVELKKRNAHLQLVKFKNSWIYKGQNIFNMFCFFIYWELILCFFGPCTYKLHFAKQVNTTYGFEYNEKNKPNVAELKIMDVNDKEYTLMVDDFIESPPNYCKFMIASDFFIGKNLRAKIENYNHEYRLFTASPVLLLAVFVLVISLIAFTFDLNHNPHSLAALSILNCLVMLSIINL